MSDQPNEYNKEAPPKQGPEAASQEKFTGGGNLVTMYQAQQGANSESFPVLQAFQDYIEAERKQARKRVVQLSISFAVIIGVVVVGFLAAGAYMMQNMTNKLFEVALSEKQAIPAAALTPVPAPVQVQAAAPTAQTSPALEESIRQMSQVLAKMQSEKSRNPVAPIAERVVQPAAPLQNPELDALKAELLAMKAQSLKLEGDISAMRVQSVPAAPVVKSQPGYRPSKVVQDALAAARVAAAEKAAQDKAVADKIAKARADAERADLARVEVERAAALEIAALRAKVERDAQAKRSSAAVSKTASVNIKRAADSRFPVADKVPPVRPQGLTVPAPPKDMMAVSVPLETKTGGVLPWRVFVPE